MRNFLRILISFISPWYSEDDAKDRTAHTEVVAKDADRAISEAKALLSSYRRAGRTMTTTWKMNGH